MPVLPEVRRTACGSFYIMPVLPEVRLALKSKVRSYVVQNHGFEAKNENHYVCNIALSHHNVFPVCSHGSPGHEKVLCQHI